MFVWPNFKLSFPKQKNQKQNESEKQKKDNSLISRMMPESVVVSMSCLFLTSIDVNPIPDTLILQQGNLGTVDTADNPPARERGPFWTIKDPCGAILTP